MYTWAWAWKYTWKVTHEVYNIDHLRKRAQKNRKQEEEGYSVKKVWKIKVFIENNVFDMTQMSNIMGSHLCMCTCVWKNRYAKENNHQMVTMIILW